MKSKLPLIAALTLSVAAADKPNIILVMADDQGWGDVGYNGHPWVKTAAMDAMAAAGFVFDRSYAAAPVCSPTRASVLTGRHPIRGKVPSYGNYLRPQEQTLAETLKSAGYVTGTLGKLHIGSGQPGTDCNPSGLYHLIDDPMETTDLAKDPAHQERLEKMRQELDAWMRSVIRSLNGKDYK